MTLVFAVKHLYKLIFIYCFYPFLFISFFKMVSIDNFIRRNVRGTEVCLWCRQGNLFVVQTGKSVCGADREVCLWCRQGSLFVVQAGKLFMVQAGKSGCGADREVCGAGREVCVWCRQGSLFVVQAGKSVYGAGREVCVVQAGKSVCGAGLSLIHI